MQMVAHVELHIPDAVTVTVIVGHFQLIVKLLLIDEFKTC